MLRWFHPLQDAERASFLIFLLFTLVVLAPGRVRAGERDATAVVVQRVSRECFVRAIHANGYVVPRAVAVVMFNAPGFRISQVLAKAGDQVTNGAIVAKVSSGGAGQAGAQELDIKSPAAGTLIGAAAFVGLPTAAAGAPLFTLAIDGEFEAALEIPGTHAFEIKPGQVAHVDARDGTALDGHVRSVPPLIDRTTQMGQARVAFDGTRHPAPGRFVRVTVEAERSCGPGVPQSAVRQTSGGARLQVVEAGAVATRTVTLGLTRDADVQVTSGLDEGALIVAEAGASLRDGDKVTAVVPGGRDTP